MSMPERQFDKELHDLKKRLLRMAAIAESMIDRAIIELMDRDEKLIASVVESEREVNLLQIEIDEEVLRLLATRQPVASDLRFIVAASKSLSGS